MSATFIGIPLILIGLVVGVLVLVFILVPLLRGMGWIIGQFFRGVGWLIGHLFEFIFGVLGDAVRLVGTIPVWLIFIVLSMLNVVVGRWSAAGHFMSAANREVTIAGLMLYRIAIRRPLKLVLLHGLLEGFEQRVPQAFGDAPGGDRPSKRTGQFDGYTIVGSLRGGGSGGKLYIAEPTAEKRAAIPHIPDRVVIKSFALADGSSLPQIVRESRALECAKSLGHVLEHGMDPQRFYYVMPYIPGDHLGVITRDLHARSDSAAGLGTAQLRDAMNYATDLLATLSAFHKGGFWHKDVKPENIIVTDGRAHLVDLGLVTALRSAMTLTTHGTEYFRDPEMVRQALRGVKVHQVDGAKFDIYAAGAVLYFMLENTFPAHGGLSAFHRKSPEALNWIVRRAMADYSQRYAQADAMLADLHHVNSHADPWSVKPADLPSMKGGNVGAVPVEPPDPVAVSFAAGHPSPRFTPDTGTVDATFDDSRFASRGDVDASKPRRPRLRVTNWWTGEYRVDDPGSATAHAGREPLTAAAAARASAFRRSPRTPGLSAAEQRAQARKRAEDIRARAHRTRPARLRAPAEMHPSSGMFGAGIAVLVIVGLFAFNPGMRNTLLGRKAATAPLAEGAPVLIVNDHALPRHSEVTRRIAGSTRDFSRDGYHVLPADPDINDEFARLVRDWMANKDNPQGNHDALLEEGLERHNLYGVLYVAGSGPRAVETKFIRSSRDEAKTRRYGVHQPPQIAGDTPIDSAGLTAPQLSGGRMIFINNHPAPISDRTRREVARAKAFYQSRGFEIIDDVDAEVRLRNAIERIPASSGRSDSSDLNRILTETGISAVLIIEGALDGPGPEDVRFTLIETESADV